MQSLVVRLVSAGKRAPSVHGRKICMVFSPEDKFERPPDRLGLFEGPGAGDLGRLAVAGVAGDTDVICSDFLFTAVDSGDGEILLTLP